LQYFVWIAQRPTRAHSAKIVLLGTHKQRNGQMNRETSPQEW
jgi:hypothetical protein